MRTRTWLSAIGIFLIICTTVFLVRQPSRRLLKVTFLNIGQGDSIFIEAPNGRQMLIDGGTDGRVLEELGSVMPFFDRSIDVVIGTHPDRDHIGGLASVLDHYDVGLVLFPDGAISDTATFKFFKEKVLSENGCHKKAIPGTSVILDDKNGVSFDILWPMEKLHFRDTNSYSVTGRLVFGKSSFILSGDLPIVLEEKIVGTGDYISSDVLKLGHHGSRTSSSENFVMAISPQIAIVSAGKNNSYGHPHKEVLDRLSLHHIPLLETKNGRILFKSDGRTLSVFQGNKSFTVEQ